VLALAELTGNQADECEFRRHKFHFNKDLWITAAEFLDASLV